MLQTDDFLKACKFPLGIKITIIKLPFHSRQENQWKQELTQQKEKHLEKLNKYIIKMNKKQTQSKIIGNHHQDQ